MEIRQNELVNLHDTIREWLNEKMTQAIALKERFDFAKTAEPDAYIDGQRQHARNLISSLKWIRSQVPKKYRNVLVMNVALLAKIEGVAVESRKESDLWQLRK